MKHIFLIIFWFSSLIHAELLRVNGIVTDTKTMLIWQDDYSDNNSIVKTDSWENAINYCESLSLGGYSDWRLPNINELLSIIDYTTTQPPKISPIFINTRSYFYWSSTTYARIEHKDFAWNISFDAAWTDKSTKTQNFAVRCVRTKQ